MKIATTRFGEIEFPEEALIRFPEGILGFPDDTSYILLEHDVDNSPFKWLQSAHKPELAFIVLDPTMLVADYNIPIDSDTVKMIELKEETQCAFMAIVNVPQDEPIRMTANLKAPLAVNPDVRLGRQVIMGSQVYSVHEPVFPRLNGCLEAAATEPQEEIKDPHSAATA